MMTTTHNERIHYTQRVYRTLLNTMARPGTIDQLEPYSYSGCPSDLHYVIGIALTLLDQEVSFHETSGEVVLTPHLKLLTRSTTKPLSESDYIFIQKGESPDLSLAKRGTDLYPDQSATIIYQVDKIKALEEGDVRFVLRGPGIEKEQRLSLDGFNRSLIPLLEGNIQHFPLGLDWILVDAEGNICCLPRSTKIVEEAKSWPM
jgi:alpha-D-ribose 1-methylphosphonate 5-triphosphate synthase subunit PhnH